MVNILTAGCKRVTSAEFYNRCRARIWLIRDRLRPIAQKRSQQRDDEKDTYADLSRINFGNRRCFLQRALEKPEDLARSLTEALATMAQHWLRCCLWPGTVDATRNQSEAGLRIQPLHDPGGTKRKRAFAFLD